MMTGLLAAILQVREIGRLVLVLGMLLGHSVWVARGVASPLEMGQAAASDARRVLVVDEADQPVAGAQVFYDGELVTLPDGGPALTDEAGAVVLENVVVGQSVVALYEVDEQASWREAHEGWAYRTYLTSLNLDDEGVPHPDLIGSAAEQVVTLRRESPLILFNLVVSIEWRVEQAYLDMMVAAFRNASDYLYDVTDGQMAFGQVAIYDMAENWEQADYQISARNTVRPYAFVGGITSEDTAHSMRVGRFWDGSSGANGRWDEPNGFRTLIHQFGHYGLYLYDEYYVSLFDENGQFEGFAAAACTGVEIIENGLDTTNASIMYYQYNASELADDDRWGINCQNTEQGRIHNKSDWQTVLDYYGGDAWELVTPTRRGSVMAGPDRFPDELVAAPAFHLAATGDGGPTRQLQVYSPMGAPFANGVVTLEARTATASIFTEQGYTNLNGEIAIYGAVAGDVIHVSSLNGVLEGMVMVDERLSYEIVLERTHRRAFLPVLFKREEAGNEVPRTSHNQKEY